MVGCHRPGRVGYHCMVLRYKEVCWQSSNLSRSFGTSPITLTISLYSECNVHSVVIWEGVGSKQHTREDVVAELILMVNPLYQIMSVAMLNYDWCLALRSVLYVPHGSGLSRLRSSHPCQVSIVVFTSCCSSSICLLFYP
jgi:hypothetical protein